MDRDKWATRREARRGQPAPEHASDWVPDPPRNLRTAFTLWMIIGVPGCLVLWGIWVVVAAFNLRQGYRGSRILLTGAAAASWLVPLSLLSAGVGWLTLVALPGVLITLAATILMWTREVTDYMASLRAR